MRPNIVLPALLLCLPFLRVDAAPARPGMMRFTQPDGTVVSVSISGDEYGHVTTSADGCAVGLDGAGKTLYYAVYDPDGAKRLSSVPVGGDAGPELIRSSRQIPYGTLSASFRRNRASRMCRPVGIAPGTRSGGPSRAIVILAQFADLKFRYGRDYFEAMLNQSGYSSEAATGSISDYFKDQFGGSVKFAFDLGPVVTLSRGYAYYGEDDADGADVRPAHAVAEACELSDAQVNFADYDYVFMFYAGGNPADGGADDNHIWPHSWSLESAGIRLVLDGKQIDAYSSSSELMRTSSGDVVISGIGTFCHEFCHALGLMDMYDTDGEKSGGVASGLWGSTSIMDKGNYNNEGRTPPAFNAVEREMLGLLDAEEMAAGTYSLEPLQSSGHAIRVSGPVETEYYLIECRNTSSWDKYIGGSGMLIYHIDKSAGDSGYSTDAGRNLSASERWSPEFNQVNCNPEHQCVDLVESYAKASNIDQVFFPYRTSFGPDTDPSFCFWSGEKCVWTMVDIRKNGQNVNFTVNGPIALSNIDPMQDAAILGWTTDVESCIKLPCVLSYGSASGRLVTVEVSPYSDGCYSYTLEGLKPGEKYEARICYRIGDQDMYAVDFSFETLSTSGLPFIYMGGAPRRNSQSYDLNRLPLRVFNAGSVRSVRWTLDGEPVSVGADGYYHAETSGELRAYVDYLDGTTDIMVKKLTVR